MPRSSSPETDPIARAIAASAPNWPRFFWSCSRAIRGCGLREHHRELVAQGRGHDLVEVPRGERRDDAHDEEQERDDRQPPGPPCLEELLAQEHGEAAHAATSSLVAREPQEDVLQRGPRAGDRDHADALGGDGRQELACRPRRVRDRDGQQPMLHRGAGDPVGAAEPRRQCLERSGLSGLGFHAVDGEREAVQQLRQRPLDHEPTMVQDSDPIADPLDVGEDMGREQDGGLAAQQRDQLEHVPPSLGIERADGLVEDDHRRPMDERAGDAQPLPHAARVGPRASVRGVGQVHPREGPATARVSVLALRAHGAVPSIASCSRPVIHGMHAGPARGTRGRGGRRAHPRPRRCH